MKKSWNTILEKFSWVGMLNVAHSPQQNPIELYFSLIKRKLQNYLIGKFQTNKFLVKTNGRNCKPEL